MATRLRCGFPCSAAVAFAQPYASNCNGAVGKRPRSALPVFPSPPWRATPLVSKRSHLLFNSPLRKTPCIVRATADQEEQPKPSSRPPFSKPPVPRSTPVDAKGTFWAAALTEAGAAVAAVGLCSVSGLPVLGKGWCLSPAELIRAVLFSIPFAAVFWAIERVPTGIEAATDASFRAFFGARTVWEVAVFCVCVAFGEELLFRSWMLAGLESFRLPPHVALLSSSVIFGVLHAYTKIYMALASVAGFMFGLMFLESGQSVLEPLVVHFLYDFCTILFMQRKWIAGDRASRDAAST